MIRNKLDKIIPKREDETLTEFAERLAEWYIQNQNLTYRKARGQYFTPKSIAEFMAGMFDDFERYENIRILDPGAGVGIFESILCERLRLCRKRISISFDICENSEEVLPLLELNMKVCQRSMARSGFSVSYRILRDDFILTPFRSFGDGNENSERKCISQYDMVIGNPPYYKLKKGSAESMTMGRVVNGQPNMYALFMAKATDLLKEGGQFVFLTPRSYCSGAYFRKFRKWFFDKMVPLRLHVFESRKVFKKDLVLQEMVILKGRKGREQITNVVISSSHDEPNASSGLVERKVPIKDVLVRRGDDAILRIPLSEIDDAIKEGIDRLPFTLARLGLKVSTGPLVPFRAVEHLIHSYSGNTKSAPLIWMHNITEGKVVWPLAKSRKAIAVRVLEGKRKLTIPNGNYVMIKRFSTKEGKRRINAGVFLRRWLGVKCLSIENHVNYIYKIGGELKADEAYGLREILNSKCYNRYFQMSNGSTQVDASAINSIPLPSLDVIATIGRLARRLGTQENLKGQRIVMTTLGISPAIADHLLDDRCDNE